MKKISIIVPIYNRENTLKRAIDSVLMQKGVNMNDIEIILIDDGSTDGSKVVYTDNYKGINNIIYSSTSTNNGPSVARNIGLQVASGEYIMFLDSDDFLEKNAIKTVLEEIEDESIDLLCFDYSVFGDKILFNDKVKRKIENEEIYDDIFECMERLMRKSKFNNVWNKVYKASLINKGVRFDKNISMGEDLKFNIDYFPKCNKAKVINKVLYHYYRNPTGLCGSNDGCMFKEVENNYMYCQQKLKQETNIFDLTYHNLLALYRGALTSAMKHNRKDLKEFFNTIINSKRVEKVISEISNLSLEEKGLVYLFKNKRIHMLYIYLFFREKLAAAVR